MAHHRRERPAALDEAAHTVADHEGWTAEEMLHALVHMAIDLQSQVAAIRRERRSRHPAGSRTGRPVVPLEDPDGGSRAD